MLELLGKATLISYYPPVLLAATFFIFFVGFIYAYAVGFLFGIKKTLSIGFFVVVLTTLLVLLFSSAYVLATQCVSPDSQNRCADTTAVLSSGSASLMLLLSHLFINLCSGHLGVFCGILLFYPSEWFLKKYTRISFLKESVAEMDTITQGKRAFTTGTINLPEGNTTGEKTQIPIVP